MNFFPALNFLGLAALGLLLLLKSFRVRLPNVYLYWAVAALLTCCSPGFGWYTLFLDVLGILAAGCWVTAWVAERRETSKKISA